MSGPKFTFTTPAWFVSKSGYPTEPESKDFQDSVNAFAAKGLKATIHRIQGDQYEFCACGRCVYDEYDLKGDLKYLDKPPKVEKCVLCTKYLCRAHPKSQPACTACIERALETHKYGRLDNGVLTINIQGTGVKPLRTCKCGNFIGPFSACERAMFANDRLAPEDIKHDYLN
jgi:hypothetical protein